MNLLEIDHIFMFIEPDGPEMQALQRSGLVETYRRQHTGQGTANVCFAFDNLYLELLWLTSEAEARSDPIARTRLWERSQWRTLGTCPFGLAFRGDLAIAGVSTWDYRPPYLAHVVPPVPAIQVAADSDDPMQPMLFSFPGSTAPRDWAAERQCRLQHAAGWTEARGLVLKMPPAAVPSAALTRLAGAAGFVIERSDHPAYGVALRLARQNALGEDVLTLPLSGR